MFLVAKDGDYGLVTIILSLACLYCAVRLGLLGKKLINVILPRSYPIRKSKISEQPETHEIKTNEE